MSRYVFSLNNSRCSDFVDRIYPVSALGQNEVLCYLIYEVPYLGPEGVKSGRPTQAVGHTKQNAFKFKIAQQKQKSIEFVLLAGRWASPSQRGPVLKHNGKSATVSIRLRQFKEYHKYRYLYFIPWPTLQNWQWEEVKNGTLRHKRWFQFSHCELSIYM
jgi:hypothetical protein